MSAVKRKTTNRTVTAVKTESNQDANYESSSEELENNTIDAPTEVLVETALDALEAMPSISSEDVQEHNNETVEDVKNEINQNDKQVNELIADVVPVYSSGVITLQSTLEQAALVDAIVKLEINIAQLHAELGNYAADNKAATGIQHSVELAKQALSRAQRAYDSAAANNKDGYSKQLEQAKMDLVAVSTKHNIMVLRIKRALDILDVLDKHLIG